MRDAVDVCGVERFGNLRGQEERAVERHRTAFQAIRQRLALEQLHHEERDAVLLPESYSAQMCGWLTREIARASR